MSATKFTVVTPAQIEAVRKSCEKYKNQFDAISITRTSFYPKLSDLNQKLLLHAFGKPLHELGLEVQMELPLEVEHKANGHSTPLEVAEAEKIAKAEQTAPQMQMVAPPASAPVDAPQQPAVPPPIAAAIAEKFVKMGAHVIFFARGTKRCITSGWQQLATNDLETALAWAQQDPYANVGLVGKKDGVWALDDDAGLVSEYEKIHGAIPTYTTRTVSGGRHLIFRQSAASWEMGNISIQDEKKRELLSARVSDRYVVAAGSWAHPHNDESLSITQYTAVDASASLIEAPQSLLDFIKEKDAEWKGKKPVDSTASASGLKVHEGGRNEHLFNVGNKLRRARATYDTIKFELDRMNQEECVPPLLDKEVETIARSCAKYEEGDGSLILNNGPVTQQTGATEQQAATAPAVAPAPAKLPGFEYPTFPNWVMQGTSIYEGFVKPYCDANAMRIPYFMWAPTAVMMMNHLGTRVKVPFRSWKPSFFIALIGRKTRTKKSSSIKDGMHFLEQAGVLEMYSKEKKSAEGKSYVWEAGSAEGLGTDMQRTNCKNAILFYDELSILAKKATIQGSSLTGTLLKLYESNSFSNSIKSKKDTFNMMPDEYVASLITSTTLKNFGFQWGTLSEGADGIDSRFSFFLEPEVLPEMTLQHVVSSKEAVDKTKALIQKAVRQVSFAIFDGAPLKAFLRECGEDDRVAIRAEKWALYFAIDLGLNEIDEDCVERGIALARYELAVKKHLLIMEAHSELAALQQDIIRKLSYRRGRMTLGALKKAVEAMKYDTIFWGRAYGGLIGNGSIAETPMVIGNRPGLSNATVTLIRGFDEDDDE
jgi:hypothetical protein